MKQKQKMSINTELVGKTNILASLKKGDKFSFENEQDIYWFICTTSWSYELFNETTHTVRSIVNNKLENAKLKIKRL